MHLFQVHFFLSMESIEKIRSIPFFFIVAKGRSGTTLMQTILDANDHVMLPIESRLILHLKKKYLSVVQWSPKVIEAFITDLYKDKKFARYWGVDRQNLQSSLLELASDGLDFPTVCKVIYLSYPSPFQKSAIYLIGDKNPVYSNFIQEMLEVFPEARFIHLVRDYRDNIVSNKKVFERQSVSLLAEGWVMYNRNIEEQRQINPDNFYLLRYEDLASDPERFVQEICKFVGITFEPKMLEFHTTINNVKEQKFVKEISVVHPNILNPVNTAQINKWKKSLSANELNLIEYCVAGKGEQYGYSGSPYTIRWYYPFVKGLAYFRVRFDIWVIRSYYNSPFFLRDFVGSISKRLFAWFKFSMYYNHADFRFNKED